MPERDKTDQEKLEEARNIIIEAFGQVYALYGLPDVIGRIYGALFFADRPLGLDDIAKELGVSKATVSVNIRLLEGVGSVRKVWQKGSRRDYYEAERDFTRILVDAIKNKVEREMEITSAAISRSKEVLSEITDSPDDQLREKAKTYWENIEMLESQYQRFGRLLLDIFKAAT
ncbi:MAG: hypothetical protein QHH75_06345 [Bacillota bacterium]|jgi:DNA-binding transcriptional regulator GbsR (MarR family)|nr:hypothetical protein [Bacillota bacterium]